VFGSSKQDLACRVGEAVPLETEREVNMETKPGHEDPQYAFELWWDGYRLPSTTYSMRLMPLLRPS